ncbi:hypothetical protein [Cereibacter sphaeroides]|uniref:hypothetical protein n=1 Tax=Cereibacter sphaeroides TaxID=1063 RepID=UPI0011AE639A|nr:hypothetical protein [Cereibacter sphaeroides]
MKMAEMFSSLKIYGTFRPEDAVYVIFIPGTIGIAAIGIISSFIFAPRGLQFLLLRYSPQALPFTCLCATGKRTGSEIMSTISVTGWLPFRPIDKF